MVRAALLMFASLAFFPSPGSAQRVDPVKLRQAVKWPEYHGGFMVGLNGIQESPAFTRMRPPSPPPQENWGEALKEFRDEPERLYFVAADWHSTHPDQAKAIFLCAKSLLETKLKENSRNGWWSALYGLVGRELDEENHADWIEKSILLSPTDARCWNALGKYRGNVELARMLKEFAVLLLSMPEEEERGVAFQRVFAQAWAGLEGARKCHDRAIELDPKNPIYVRDRLIQTGYKCMNGVFLTGMKKFTPEDFDVDFKRLEEDLRRLTRFCPEEEDLWAMQALWRLMFMPGSKDDETPKDDAKTQALRRLQIKEECDVLTRLARQRDPNRGANAAFFVASMQRECGDLARAEEYSDLALLRDADHQKASELKERLLMKRKEIDRARRLSLKRLEKSRSARNLFLFATTFMETDEQAVLLIREALEREPRHLPSLLAMAAVHLRKSAHPICLDRASGYLQQVDDVLKVWQDASSEERVALEREIDKDSWVEYSLKIYRSVIDSLRGETLVPWVTLRELQREYPQEDELKKLLEAFE